MKSARVLIAVVVVVYLSSQVAKTADRDGFLAGSIHFGFLWLIGEIIYLIRKRQSK